MISGGPINDIPFSAQVKKNERDRHRSQVEGGHYIPFITDETEFEAYLSVYSNSGLLFPVTHQCWLPAGRQLSKRKGEKGAELPMPTELHHDFCEPQVLLPLGASFSIKKY